MRIIQFLIFICLSSIAYGDVPIKHNETPTVQIISPKSKLTIIKGQTITFIAEGKDPNNLPLTYVWTFGADILSGSRRVARRQFTETGEYTASVTVTNVLDVQSVKTARVKIKVIEAPNK